jgi:ribose 5-phosphate isomerase B
MTGMRVHLGSDHAGLELKQHLVGWLREQGHEPLDHGPYTYDAEDDYPPYCLRTGAAVVADPGSLGIVIGGSGNGEQIAANKVPGVRAALVWSTETAELARLHNDANVMSVGARMHGVEEAISFVQTYLSTEFTAEPRHTRRIKQLAHYEVSHEIPSAPEADRAGAATDE